MIDQDEAARSAGERSLDRTTQTTGQHCRDGFCDQDEAARSAGERGQEKQRARDDRVRIRVRVRARARVEESSLHYVNGVQHETGKITLLKVEKSGVALGDQPWEQQVHG